MVSISGIRGKIPEGLNPENIVLFTSAFASVTGKKIVIGNDSRPTGELMRHLIIGTLIGCGKEIIDIGLAPTPTVKAAVNSWKADGGIMISASHNPLEWNAFKLIEKGGWFFSAEMFAKLKAAVEKKEFPYKDYRQTGSVRVLDGVENHIESVLNIIPNIAQIRKKKYSIVVDAVGGAGREALPQLLDRLGCRVVPLYCEESPRGFPRAPEPTPSALREFGALVKKEKAAAGFALDPDADRLVVGSPKQGTLNEEYTVPLSLLGFLSAHKNGVKGKAIVVNLSTANLVDFVAEKAGMKMFRSPVGEANVVAMMRKGKAVFGGEGNGGVIHPEVPSYGRDSLTGAALILSAMAARNAATIDSLTSEIPPLHMEKIKVELKGNPQDALNKVKSLFLNVKHDERDGLHILFPDRAWVHVRSSNTEPIMRVIAQAPSKSRLKEILDAVNASFR